SFLFADIDECAFGICPYNSLCFNTIGSYYCQCKPGFRPTSSLDIFTESFQTCGDVDECSLVGYCPKNSVCFNINGSYYCQCKTGFRSTSRTTNFTSVSEKCTDIDECRENVMICGVNTICSNTIGKYYCTCKPGYKSSSGEENFNTTNNVLCEDVNECKEDQGICGSNATCRNTDGSYRCDCHLGFSNRGNSTGHCSAVQCRVGIITFLRTIVSTSSGVDNPSDNFAMEMGSFFSNNCFFLLQVPASSIEKCLSNLFSSKNITSYEPKKIVGAISSFLNQSVLQTNLTVHERSIAGEMLNGNTLQVNLQSIMQNASNGIGTVLFASYTGLEFLLDGRYFQNKSSEDIVSPQINSNIVTVVVNQKKNHIHTLLQPINVTFQNKQHKRDENELICVYWKYGVNESSWSQSGLKAIHSNETHTVCSSNHLTTFAVVMATKAEQIEEDSALSVIEYVFVITSLICLGLAIITFVFCKSVQKGHNTIHLHLSLCLFMAHLLLLTGGSKTENKIICAVIAGALHFLFLASFVWMCLEGVQLLLLVTNLRVVKYSSRNRLTKRYLFPPGYPPELPYIYIVTNGGLQKCFLLLYVLTVFVGRHTSLQKFICWLSFERAFAWSFLGPVSFFISVNIIMFAIILWALKSQLSFINTDVSKVRNTRLLTFKAMAHCFIMGCSWILGFFQGVKFFSYMFVIINSLQGPFIFLVHCVLNQQIRAEYRRWFRCTHKKKNKSESSGITMRTLAVSETLQYRLYS
ncbi:AGRE1 protein, partial [Atractosteus spatula]|nr:AGRE1 protein [Atractosteus spatula]